MVTEQQNAMSWLRGNQMRCCGYRVTEHVTMVAVCYKVTECVAMVTE